MLFTIVQTVQFDIGVRRSFVRCVRLLFWYIPKCGVTMLHCWIVGIHNESGDHFSWILLMFSSTQSRVILSQNWACCRQLHFSLAECLCLAKSPWSVYYHLLKNKISSKIYYCEKMPFSNLKPVFTFMFMNFMVESNGNFYF